MSEKEDIFSSNVKYKGLFTYKDFYVFCYKWLSEETNLNVAETKYSEKISGDTKEVDIEWDGTRKVTDYFKFQVKAVFKITQLKDVEIAKDGIKMKTNQGDVSLKLKGTLIRDYDGKFERNGFQKFIRSIYEKYVIPGRIEQFEDKLIGDCDEFLLQVKAYLDLEGKR